MAFFPWWMLKLASYRQIILFDSFFSLSKWKYIYAMAECNKNESTIRTRSNVGVFTLSHSQCGCFQHPIRLLLFKMVSYSMLDNHNPIQPHSLVYPLNLTSQCHIRCHTYHSNSVLPRKSMLIIHPNVYQAYVQRTYPAMINDSRWYHWLELKIPKWYTLQAVSRNEYQDENDIYIS